MESHSSPPDLVYYLEKAENDRKHRRFKAAISSLTTAVEQFPEHLASYTALADIYKETNDLANCEKILDQLLRLSPDIPCAISLKHEINSHKFQKLIDWLAEGGAEFPKIKIKSLSNSQRAVFSSVKIFKSECVLYIPRSHIITLEMAKSTRIGWKMDEAGLDLLSPKHSFLSSFILQERRSEHSFWRPYLDILPTDVSNFPIFYTEEEKELLEGSPFLTQVEEKVLHIESDYSQICQAVPEFSAFPLKEFAEVRMLVSSRIFSMNIDGLQTDGLVPFADMLNHKINRETNWYYKDDENGFVIDSLEDIAKEVEVCDNYGVKCNSRFLLNYGFILKNNNADEFPLIIGVAGDESLFNFKIELLGSFRVKLRVQANEESSSFRNLLKLMRIAHLDIGDPLMHKDFYNEPFSLTNEVKVLERVKETCLKSLSMYRTSLEEDFLILTNKPTINEENCILMRKGEKVVLRWYLNFAEMNLLLIKSGSVTESYPYKNYLASLIPLIDLAF